MKQILFIDDDPVVIAIYRERLERAGFRVNVAEDGLAAMEQLKTLRPDLAVLDLMLPKANGVEVLRYLRGDAALRALPVIVFSNAYLSGLVAQAREVGANKVLLKAESSPATLLRAIHEFLPAHETRCSPTGRTVHCV
ncbi:MAG TPA: response regulator [Verrucomicrobiae bacterium]